MHKIDNKLLSIRQVIAICLIIAAIFAIGDGLSRKVLVSTLFLFLFITASKKYLGAQLIPFIKSVTSFLDKHCYWLLVLFITIYVLWSGTVMFLNPYEWGYNHGDSIFYTQTLHNMTHGFLPESSYFTFSKGLPSGIDPRYTTAYGYVSIFALHQSWLPIAFLTPLYAFYPYPPMHIFAQLIVIVCLGIPGTFHAIRSLGATKSVALLGAICYSLIPQVEIQLFFKGYFDILALAVMPWIFAGLFARNAWLFCLSSFALAIICLPYTYTVIAIGIIAAIFFGQFLSGLLVIIIGTSILMIDIYIYGLSIEFYKTGLTGNISIFKHYLHDKPISYLVKNFTTTFKYTLHLLITVGILPIAYLLIYKKRRYEILGILILVILNTLITSLRSIGWEAQRNANLIVPVFLCAFYAAYSLNDCGNKYSVEIRHTLLTLLFCGIASSIAWGSGFKSPSPLASHLPFGQNAKLYVTDNTVQRRNVLKQIENYLPRDAPLAFMAEGWAHAPLANRQHVWHIGREPDGVKYYLFLGTPASSAERFEWEKLTGAMLSKKNYMQLLNCTISGVNVILLENQLAYPTPRQEDLLGWGVLIKSQK